MSEQLTTSRNEDITAAGRPMSGWLHLLATLLAGIAIVSSAFHFWPFQSSKAWQIFCTQNLAVLVWILFLARYFLVKRAYWTIGSSLPHLSILAYLTVSILSMAFAPDLSRAANFSIKLALVLVGGYTLFSYAICNARTLQIVYGCMTAAAVISVSYCLIGRFGFDFDNFGFHYNAYKYGTYIGILSPLCGAYLFTSPRPLMRLLGTVLVMGAFVSSGSLGALAAITLGAGTLAILTRGWPVRLCITISLLCGVGLLFLLGSNPVISVLHNDLKLADEDGVNLKQRYIEWQAEVNLLEERPLTGTGAGCINQYRSNFYYRLPKLNTLKAFDQNGWLATGAEIGILGLVCFCWIAARYFSLALSQVRAACEKEFTTAYRFATVNLAGLVAACTANLFSSLHYNGILIVFVLVLVLIDRTELLCGDL
ncbi:MAG TPA: O-antigen ligase family protein [Sedimentisphaerales bacterium]|nr:O-antigen ligase family protein [Sedimentisphaerales bacterium]